MSLTLEPGDKLVVATHNPGKARELAQILENRFGPRAWSISELADSVRGIRSSSSAPSAPSRSSRCVAVATRSAASASYDARSSVVHGALRDIDLEQMTRDTRELARLALRRWTLSPPLHGVRSLDEELLA